MTDFTHLNSSGEAHMVDVSDRDVSDRASTAAGFVSLRPETITAIRDARLPKGDVLSTARIAGIQAAKRTPDLIPLCHPIAVHGVDVDASLAGEQGARFVEIVATVRTADRTGVEMEALTCAAVGALTVIDMVKGKDRSAAIVDVVLLEKLGGRSGHWVREA